MCCLTIVWGIKSMHRGYNAAAHSASEQCKVTIFLQIPAPSPR